MTKKTVSGQYVTSYSRDRVGGMRYNDHLAKRRRAKCRLRRERAKLRRQGE